MRKIGRKYWINSDGIRRQFKNGDDRDRNARLEFLTKMKQGKLKKQNGDRSGKTD
jgi:hypothetical protein